MTSSERQRQHELTVLIWAPIGRDAQLARDALERAGIGSVVCRTLAQACVDVVAEHTGAAVLAEESLTRGGIDQIRGALSEQPAWSAVPLVLLTGGGRSTEASLANLQRMRTLGNITLLERPLRSVTLVAAVRSALMARERQLQIRDYVRDLQETQKNLAKANADLKQFAFAASHDLQEPLRMVNVFSQLLIQRHVDPSNEEARQFADYIRTGVKRMEALLRDVLDYSRVIHGSEAWPAEPFDLQLAIQDAVSVSKVMIEESGAKVTWQSMPPVRGDRNQLSLVFQNLISNSIKYRRHGVQPEITIDASALHGELLIKVRDNGIGFDQMYADRIFDLFQRLDNSDGVTGTGLGLAICRRTIEKHGGRMWAESSPGKGATFFFTLSTHEGHNE